MDVWFRADEVAIDIHGYLHDELEAVTIQAARVQACSRGWFVRRSILSARVLEREIAACPASVSPRLLTPTDLYLHHVASRLSWVYCERIPRGHTLLAPVIDALSLRAPPSPPIGRASSAKKHGKRQQAAQRAERIRLRTTNQRAVLSHGGSLFRFRYSRRDAMRLLWLQHAEERFDHERCFTGLRSDPIVPIRRVHSSLRADDPFLLELRARFGARIIDGLYPREAREDAKAGAELYSYLARLFGPILDHGQHESDDDDTNLDGLPDEDLGGSSY